MRSYDRKFGVGEYEAEMKGIMIETETIAGNSRETYVTVRLEG